MTTIRRQFLSRDAAEAFIAGLEYVNESSIDNIKLVIDPHGDFAVEFEDEDVHDEDDIADPYQLLDTQLGRKILGLE